MYIFTPILKLNNFSQLGIIYHELETDEKYLFNFKRSNGYLKLLAELDIKVTSKLTVV